MKGVFIILAVYFMMVSSSIAQSCVSDATISPAGNVNICIGGNATLSAPTSNVWTQKADIGGLERYYSVGFSIGLKGYIGTGQDINGFKKDFWEYDPFTNAWTQKADFGGNATDAAVGFSIESKGYIANGYGGGFWEYDPISNIWIQKANFGGTARSGAIGFSIGSKGYIGTGSDGTLRKDFWEYDPVSNGWSQKANFGGSARALAVGFSIGSKGYIGTGQTASGYENDFWEYDPVSNSWTRKANFGGSARYASVGFGIGSKGYISTGQVFGGLNKKDFWEYDPVSNTWLQKIDFAGTGRFVAVGFSIGPKGYIGTGVGNSSNKDFWEYDPGFNYLWSSGQTTSSINTSTAGNYTVTTTNALNCSATSIATVVNISSPIATINPSGTVNICQGDNINLTAPPGNVWVQKNNFPGIQREAAFGFSIGTKGYLGSGSSVGYYNDFWEYDPVSNTWAQKADFGGVARALAVGFSIGEKGYAGIGANGFLLNDFWEYDPLLNIWAQKANFGGTARSDAVGFSIGAKGYIGTGYNGSLMNDFWEYDPLLNIWTQKANFGGTARSDAVGFSIGAKGYIGTGYDGSSYENDFWEYDPLLNIWAQKANFGGTARAYAVGFSFGPKGYIGTGSDGNFKNDFWEYNPLLNIWTQKADFGGTGRDYAVGMGIGNKGYIGTGWSGPSWNDFWEYTPEYSYNWSSGQTTQSITVSAGIYTVTITDPMGCNASSPATIINHTDTYTWAGGGTSDWNTSANWSCGIVPNNSLINAVVLNDAVPMPVLSTDVMVRDINLNGTATVDINGKTLTINRAIMGTGSLKGSITSCLTLKGDAGDLRFDIGSSVLKDLLITDTGSATLLTPLNITAGSSPGSVTVNSNAVLYTNGNLTLNSDVNGTSRVGILTGNISGDVTVERFINTGNNSGEHAKSWQFLATPTNGQTIYQAWQENGPTPTGYGTWITGTGTGFDTVTVLPSIKFYDQSTINWAAVTNTFNPLHNKLGYMVFVRGDRTVTTFNSTPNNTNMRSKGVLFTPFNPPPSLPASANQFQSFGNPYASRIEFNKVYLASTGINDVFYVWDPKLSGTYNLGGYQTLSGITGYIPTAGNATSYYPGGIPSPYIESGQAVFVQGNSIGGNINFDENCKVTGSRLVNKAPGANTTFPNRQFLFASLFTNTEMIADGNIVAFENGLGNELNENDAKKRLNDGENFSIGRNGTLLAVEARNAIMSNDTIYYDIKNLKQRPYQFRFSPVNMPTNLNAFLIDRFSNSSTIINLTDSSFIDFTVSGEQSSSASNRFILVFKRAVVVPVKLVYISAVRNNNKTISVNWKVENESNIELYKVERSEDGRNFVEILTALPANNNGGSSSYLGNDLNPLITDNFYRISALSLNGLVQYSAVVKVSPIKTIPGIIVYPNPLKNKTLQIEFKNQHSGNYYIQLINKLGQIIYNTSLQLNNGNVIKTIPLDAGIASGAYQLIILNDKEILINQQVLIQ